MTQKTTLVDLEPHCNGTLGPSVSDGTAGYTNGVSSPYFQVKRPQRRIGTDGIRILILVIMAKRAIIFPSINGNQIEVDYQVWTDSTYNAQFGFNYSPSGDVTGQALLASIGAAVVTNAATHSHTLDSTMFNTFGPIGLTTSPQAAIGNATNNLPTNFNLVSGLLGVANGLNDANTAQNDMANKFNSLVSELRTLGLISA